MDLCFPCHFKCQKSTCNVFVLGMKTITTLEVFEHFRTTLGTTWAQFRHDLRTVWNNLHVGMA